MKHTTWPVQLYYSIRYWAGRKPDGSKTKSKKKRGDPIHMNWILRLNVSHHSVLDLFDLMKNGNIKPYHFTTSIIIFETQITYYFQIKKIHQNQVNQSQKQMNGNFRDKSNFNSYKTLKFFFFLKIQWWTSASTFSFFYFIILYFPPAPFRAVCGKKREGRLLTIAKEEGKEAESRPFASVSACVSVCVCACARSLIWRSRPRRA